MAGLLGDVLPFLYSQGDRAKRYVGGLLGDPMGTITREVNNGNDRAGAMLGLLGQAANEGMNYGPATQKMAGMLADAYNPVAATVWHGSPHRFNKFDSSKIGTGEGAQAYGHGLYLAEAPDVARTYSADRAYVGAAMQGKPQAINYDDPAWIAQKTIDELGDPAKAKAHLEMVARTAAKHMTPESAAGVRGAIDLVSSGAVGPKGNLYKVDLPDETIGRMLDWDKPLSQQAPEVQAALANTKNKHLRAVVDYASSPYSTPGLEGEVKTMGEAIKLLGMNQSPAKGSQMLAKQGIPGIRYLDGGSRGAGGGTSNFVVFPGNESLLTILERNGLPLP